MVIIKEVNSNRINQSNNKFAITINERMEFGGWRNRSCDAFVLSEYAKNNISNLDVSEQVREILKLKEKENVYLMEEAH